MKYIRTHARQFALLVSLFVAMAGLSACGSNSGTSTTTGAGVSGSGA